MIPIEVINKLKIIKEVFRTEVAPRMWQYLRLCLGPRIAIMHVMIQLLHIVKALFSDKDEAALQTDPAKGFLMFLFNVLL